MEYIKTQLKRDWQTIKALKGGERWEYIWDYYKIPIIVILFILFAVGYTVSTNLTRGKINMYAIFVNSYPAESSACMEEILSDAGFDMDTYDIAVECNYTVHLGEGADSDTTTLQVLAAQFLIGDLDLFVADQPVFDMYTQQGGFENVGILLSPELKEKYADDLYLVETENGDSYIGGVWLRKGSALHEAGYYSEDVIAGIASQAQNLEEAFAVLSGLLATNP